MPCTSNYPEPTERNRFLRHTAQLLIFVCAATRTPIPPALRVAAEDSYCMFDGVDTLCAMLTTLREEDNALFNALVYNAYRRESRELATWWEDHLKADAERTKRENADTERAALRQQALAKLTPAEMDALGIKH